MERLEEQFREAMEATARTRFDFLLAELQTCFLCVDLGKYEYSVGNTEVTTREIEIAERGVGVVERFVPELSAQQRTEILPRLERLKAALDELKVEAGGG